MTSTDLTACGVLVTRPAQQALALTERLQRQGATVVLLPLLQIEAVKDERELRSFVDQLDNYHMAIFISPNAVHYAISYIIKQRSLPTTLQLATVGKGSAQRLHDEFGLEVDIVPSHEYNSESLLSEKAMQQVAGKHIAIVRGNAGRELLATTLRQRGATVTTVTSYQRSIPQQNSAYHVEQWQQLSESVFKKCIIITSGEACRNLLTVVGETARDWLNNAQLIVVHSRIANIAQQLGFKVPPRVARNASDDALLECIQEWYQNS